MEELKYEEFFDEVWDYVSEDIVDDVFWDNNQPMLRELTYDLYYMYKNSLVKTNYDSVIFNPLSPKVVAKLIETFFTNLNINHGKRS